MKTIFVTGGSGYLGRNLLDYLRHEGINTVALARSEKSKKIVEEHGAQAVLGDILDTDSLSAGMKDCDAVIHCAAAVTLTGSLQEMRQANVQGTINVLEAARKANVPRVVHVSSESVLVDGNPLVKVTETHPYPKTPIGNYAQTKGEAEKAVLEANGKGGLETVVIRPRLIWGKDDSVVLPGFVAANRSGDLAWFGGGAHQTSTVHVTNVCEGALLAATNGRAGEIYFLKDQQDHTFREFISKMLEAVGEQPTKKELPLFLGRTLACVSEWWSAISGKEPLLTHAAISTLFIEVTVDDSKARTELGYVGKVSFEEGLKDLAERSVT